jgi:hypothetical protein
VLQRYSNQNPLYFVNADLVVAAIVEARGAGALVVRHLLRHFKLAAVAQILRDAGGAEDVATDLGCDAGVGRAPADHAVHVGLAHGAASNGAGLAFGRCKQPRFRVHHSHAVLLRRGVEDFEVVVQMGFQLVMAGHFVALTTLLVQPSPVRRP